MLAALAAMAAADATSGCLNVPKDRVDCYPFQTGFPNATEESCLAQGCCWDPSQPITCAFGGLPAPKPEKCSAVVPSSRMECRNPRYFPQTNSSSVCAAMGCCFDDTTLECFQPAFEGYQLNGSTLEDTPTGFQATLVLPDGLRGPFGNDIRKLKLDVDTQQTDRVRVRIFDPNFARYEVPVELHNLDAPKGVAERLYSVTLTYDPFGIAIKRKATGEVLFDSTPNGEFNGLIFENQFLEFSTSTPSQANFFGMGEHVGRFLSPTEGDHYTIFARDQASNMYNAHTKIGSDNVYGVHPFYVRRELSGKTHGFFLRNSNAMEVVAQNKSITFRSVGGIIDFFVFLGPAPATVVQQYTALVGRPLLPPYWTLGYHLCRWHNHVMSDVTSVVDRMRAHGVPQDGQWTDIDVMDRWLDFTWDPVNFPQANMSAFIDDLHAHDQHYVPIVDAGISNQYNDYISYREGLDMDVYMKDPANKGIEENKVWPGMVAFPDFFHPNATKYWGKQLTRYHDTAKYDGIWLDMNEPSSFCFEGGRESLSCMFNDSFVPSKFVKSADVMAPFDPYRQSYVPGQKVVGNLATKTAALGSHQYNSIHYNLHSLYGHSELMTTRKVIDKIRGKRSFILSRSTYAGDGQYTAHWLGDNGATWPDMHYSIAGVLSMNLFGIPMVGPDVCGFSFDTTKELCVRWHQTAILYPFMRNHNEGKVDQAPVDFDDEALVIIRDTLFKRYALLPYLYTQLYHASVDGATTARSLYFEFPEDLDTLDIDSQYLLGSGLMVAPVLKEKAVTVDAYFPKAAWFNVWTGERVNVSNDSRTVTLDAPLDTVHVFIKGGSVVTWQLPNTTTAASRKNPFALKIAFPDADNNSHVEATGDLYMDSGDSIDPIENKAFSVIEYLAKHYPTGLIELTATVAASGYTGPETQVPLSHIEFYGTRGLNDGAVLQVDYTKGSTKRSTNATYNATSNTVTVDDLSLEIGSAFTLQVFPKANALTTGPTTEPPTAGTRGSGDDESFTSGVSWWAILIGVAAAVLVCGGVWQIFRRRNGYSRVE
ncbi:lysosomal alpha-glucosidase [Thraustotheca clavata]|uniref:Maltase n=1 Tax=Thraustotheca clavata TaxID=74557 RepID=A0A1W0A4K2_9STRA|nr:lysosomal alpha-glucosidase [Thraustotheca clavata]